VHLKRDITRREEFYMQKKKMLETWVETDGLEGEDAKEDYGGKKRFCCRVGG